MTSPSGFNCVTAPAKVWHGVAMLSQALALLPRRAETKTRLASARAGEAAATERTQTPRPANRRRACIKSSFEERDVATEDSMRPPLEPPAPAAVRRDHIGENEPMMPEA